MTDDDGKVLKECHTRMALLDYHYQSMGAEVRELGAKVDGLAGSVGGLERTVRDEVLPAIRNIPGMMAVAVHDHESNDPLHSAVTETTRRDLTQMLRQKMKSEPSGHGPDFKEQSLVTKNRLISAIAALLLAAASVIGGTQIPSCQDHTSKDTKQWHSNQE
jgi:hypothetical protein